MTPGAGGQIAGHAAMDSRRFVLAVRRLADSLSYGTDHSPFLGSGLEYVQTRPYQFGDPVRSIDWRVTARTGRFHVKEYEATKRLPVYLLVDTSASMTFGSHSPSKYETAVFLAGGLALAALDRVSPVGVLGVGGRALHVRPSLSKDQALQWLHRLRSYHFDEPTSLTRRVAELAPSLPHRVLMIVLSDLHEPGALTALKRLGQSHDCAVLQLRDPSEHGLRGVGFVRAREAETGRPFVARGRGDWHDQAHTSGVLKRAGIDHLLIDTDRPFVPSVRRFFKARSLLGRGVRMMATKVFMRCPGIVFLAPILLSFTPEADASAESPVPTVGMPATLRQVVLPGPELEVGPIDEFKTPVVVRITGVYPHGSAFRYDIVYYAIRPGTYDLTTFLKRKDGVPAVNLPPVPVTVVSALPPGPSEPHAMKNRKAPRIGGYRTALEVGGLVWSLGLVLILYVSRRRPSPAEAAEMRQPTLSDRLRVLVESARNGTLGPERHAELERLLIGYWRRRLGLENADPSAALTAIRLDENAGPLLRRLEDWLHKPGGTHEVDLPTLLSPYSDMPPENPETDTP